LLGTGIHWLDRMGISHQRRWVGCVSGPVACQAAQQNQKATRLAFDWFWARVSPRQWRRHRLGGDLFAPGGHVPCGLLPALMREPLKGTPNHLQSMRCRIFAMCNSREDFSANSFALRSWHIVRSTKSVGAMKN